ncbi:sodium ion-translocating decarboxylase subunit beta [Sinanaerobacter chloroacetimidivorans]|jgi:sodium ion-translocating decarboxylase beta subunit|uniref:Sodium ion-translocating decarboxylase subunit beta n=1 Tax=Sinanaerobacter chloroacetimidivorans TaxID=2818044 RepID=A0A8J7VZN4_9FIRM|nr:sodium ion-translocating decarboxylase subunit beta [Sinanaerobacter chloroacetimidivorans]MBR0596923.1 sodium ion-translocating decarboxylase subunit beta [Sinanaerobacter chloroacetimidivorans]
MNLSFLFQGFGTLFYQEPKIAIARVVLIAIGILLVYLGKKGTLEPLIMIPMGFGMSAVNAGVLFFSAAKTGTLFVDPLVSDTDGLMGVLQIDFLQPIYTFAFGNSLIACIVFMGVGVLADVGNVLRYPFTSMLIALFAELGTIVTFPIATAMGLNYGEAAAISIVGTADGPMVLFTSLMLAPELFVPITVIAYLYLSLTYGGYPFLVRLMIPKEMRGIAVKTSKKNDISSGQKIAFDIIACTLLSLLFPVAGPLFLSFFLGNAIKESGIIKYSQLIEDVFLYTATFFLGLMLGVLCEASTIMNPKVLILLVLGIIALTLSGVGGIIGGYIVYLINHKKFNPVIGIAGVSCVPSTAKIAQHEAANINKRVVILQYAMGASICGVITSAILTGIYVTLIPLL